MKRRSFLTTVAAGAMANVLAGAENASNAPAAPSSPQSLVRTPLVLMAPRDDGCDAVWAVNSLCGGRIEWQGDDGLQGVAATDALALCRKATACCVCVSAA